MLPGSMGIATPPDPSYRLKRTLPLANQVSSEANLPCNEQAYYGLINKNFPTEKHPFNSEMSDTSWSFPTRIMVIAMRRAVGKLQLEGPLKPTSVY